MVNGDLFVLVKGLGLGGGGSCDVFIFFRSGSYFWIWSREEGK